MTLGEARARFARYLRLDMDGQADIRRLRTLLSSFGPGSAPVHLRYRNPVAECELVLGEEMRVRLDDALIEELGRWLKPENVQIIYQ